MKTKRNSMKLCAMMLVLFVLSLGSPLSATQSSSPASPVFAKVATKIVYSQKSRAIAGQRIPLRLEVTDTKGVDRIDINWIYLSQEEKK